MKAALDRMGYFSEDHHCPFPNISLGSASCPLVFTQQLKDGATRGFCLSRLCRGS